MDEAISATDANRYFSALIRGVQDGQTYLVTSHGQPVARLVPIRDDDPILADAARQRQTERPRILPALSLGPSTRADAYDDPSDEAITN